MAKLATQVEEQVVSVKDLVAKMATLAVVWGRAPLMLTVSKINYKRSK